MVFRDPLKKFPEINDRNSIDVDVENFLELTDKPQSFKDAINSLSLIRKTLRTISLTNRLSEVSSREHYTYIIQWLKGEVPLSYWVTLPPLGSYNDIDEAVANSLNLYVSNLSGTLNSQALYQQAQLVMAAIESKMVDDISQNAVKDAERKFESALLESQRKLVESIESTSKEKNLMLSTLFNSQLESIRLEGKNAIANFESARALANWSAFYATRVRVYDDLVYGRKWPKNAVVSKWRSFRAYRNSLSSYEADMTRYEVVAPAIGCFQRGSSILWSKFRSYSGKRTMWFAFIGLAVLSLIVVNAAAIYDMPSILGIDFAKLKPTHSDTQIFAKVSFYVAFFLIPLVGYSFANKNYRIYSNLLEQYRHREVVAETIQGILAKPKGDETDEIVRKELTNVAAAALFEQKTVGHLSKNEANSTSLLDIARVFRSS